MALSETARCAVPKRASRSDYLDAMSLAATGVNIVTTDGPAGRAGLTVSAMSSVSADGSTPQLLVCINSRGPSGRIILDNGVFAVNVLRDDQQQISDVFAGRRRSPVADRFSCGQWLPMSSGAPRLVDPLAAFDCQVTDTRLVGTHFVIFGAVVDIFHAERGAPLIYTARAYASPCCLTRANLAA